MERRIRHGLGTPVASPRPFRCPSATAHPLSPVSFTSSHSPSSTSSPAVRTSIPRCVARRSIALEARRRTSRSPCPARATGARRACGRDSPRRRAGRPAPPRAVDRGRRCPRPSAPRATSARTSASSSSTFSAGPLASGQSKPTPAARSCSRNARCRAGRSAGSPSTMLVALLRLHPLPALALAAVVQVRMARLHLREETFRHVAEVECTALLGDHAVKEHLEQQVAELLAQQRVVAGADRVVHLVRFLDQIWAQRLVRLRRIPLAARRRSFISASVSSQSRLFLHRSPRVRILFSLHMIAHRAVR